MTLTTQINTLLPDNNTGAITPLALRTVLLDTANAFSVPRRVLLYGDSIMSFGSSYSAGATTGYNSEGIIPWYNRLSGHALFFDPTLNKGVVGETTTQILARLLTDVSANSTNFDILIGMAGKNDNGSAISAATSIANIKSMINQCLGLGKTVIWFTILPGTGLTATVLAQQAQINQALREYARQLNGDPFILVDPWRDLVDPTKTDGSPATTPVSLFTDGIHPAGSGCYLVAKRMIPSLSGLLPPMPSMSQGGADIYDVTNNTQGNLLSHSQLDGTGGTLSAGSGVFATGWTLSKGAGSWVNSEVVGTKVDSVAGYGAVPGSKQVITVNIASGKTATEQIQFYQIATIPNATSQYYAEIEVDLSGIARMFEFYIFMTNLAVTSQAWDGQSVTGTISNPIYPDTYTQLVLRTPLWTPPGGTSQVYVIFRATFDAVASGATAVIKLACPQLRVYQ